MTDAAKADAAKTHRMSTPEVIDRVRALAGTDGDGPVMMLNVNRYTSDAGFPGGAAHTSYMNALEHAVGNVGGSVLWRTSVVDQIIGCEHDEFDELLAVWYPSRQAFLELPEADGAAAMFEGRRACVANALILELPADAHPFASLQSAR